MPSAPLPTLIIRLPNHLGDACMALPALECLAARGHALVLVGRPWAQDLLAAHPWRVVGLPAGRTDRVGILRELARGHAQAQGLLLTNSISSALEFRLAGLRPSGYATDGRRLLLRSAIAVPHEWAGDMHTVAYYLHLARSLGAVRGAAQDMWRPLAETPPRLGLTAQAQARAARALERAGVTGPYVVLCPVARGQHHGQNKCWGGFAQLASALRADGHTIVVCPGPGEEVAAREGAPGAKLIEPLPVDAFAALLGGSRLVVANDSGPGHLAAAVGAPLVGVFGVTDPTKTRPLGRAVQIIGGASGWPPYGQVADAVAEALGRSAPAA